MERIKQAVAKDKQASNGGEQVRSAGVQQAMSQRQNAADPAAGEISYKQTRVVKLQVDHLISNRIFAFSKNNAMTMNIDLLRTQVLQKMKENGWRTLAITSPTPAAGKTVVAINLAISIAQQTDTTAMLVDFDLRRPKVGTYLGIPMAKSLNDFLDGKAELPDVLINPDMPRLVVLATKTPVSKSSETLSSKKISSLIHELRDRYESRVIIFDLPPVLGIDDALALLPQIDCVLLVVANGLSTKREIEDSLRYLQPEKLIGSVLNKAEMETSAPYYY